MWSELTKTLNKQEEQYQKRKDATSNYSRSSSNNIIINFQTHLSKEDKQKVSSSVCVNRRLSRSNSRLRHPNILDNVLFWLHNGANSQNFPSHIIYSSNILSTSINIKVYYKEKNRKKQTINYYNLVIVSIWEYDASNSRRNLIWLYNASLSSFNGKSRNRISIYSISRTYGDIPPSNFRWSNIHIMGTLLRNKTQNI